MPRRERAPESRSRRRRTEPRRFGVWAAESPDTKPRRTPIKLSPNYRLYRESIVISLLSMLLYMFLLTLSWLSLNIVTILEDRRVIYSRRGLYWVVNRLSQPIYCIVGVV